MVGAKRSSADLGEKLEFGLKRVKMRDLDSVLRSENIDAHYPIHTEIKGKGKYLSLCGGKKKSQLSEDTATTLFDVPILVCAAPRQLDLNAKDWVSDKKSSYKERDIEKGAIGWDLNTKSVCGHDGLKSGEALECESTTGSLEEKGPMKVGKDMKQHHFLSSSPRGIPVLKPCGRKSKSDGPEKKVEIPKTGQIDRFAKAAAPSGLLNELNPGIINHVRNRKQVHSIIDAVVKSLRLGNDHPHAQGKQPTQMKNGTKEITDMKNPGNGNALGIHRLVTSHDEGPFLSENQQQRDCVMLARRVFPKTTCFSQPIREGDDEITTTVLDNTSSLSSEESANVTIVSPLSVKAASVASQWLKLLSEDIKRRLAALRCSKKRVRAVLHRELPFLMSREFSNNHKDNDPRAMKISGAACSGNRNAAVYQATWISLFDQMDRALSDEETQLESWLNQVEETQLHCQWGLQHIHFNAVHFLKQLGPLENDSRLKEVDYSERGLAVRAAAASIYSTCNFLLSSENVPCF